jgi:hypothetical protein
MRMLRPGLVILSLLVCLVWVGSTPAFAAGRAVHMKPLAKPLVFHTADSSKGSDSFDLAKAMESTGCYGYCYPGTDTCLDDCECSGNLSCCVSGCGGCCSTIIQ